MMNLVRADSAEDEKTFFYDPHQIKALNSGITSVECSPQETESLKIIYINFVTLSVRAVFNCKYLL